MPMQLANGALLQVLLRGCDVVALRQIIVDLFTDPATGVDSGLCVGEAPLEVWHGAGIGTLLAQVRGILDIHLAIGATYKESASMSTLRDAVTHTQNRSAFSLTIDWLTIGERSRSLALDYTSQGCRREEHAGHA